MAESFLSFGNSETFRKQLLVRNLSPYNVPGSYNSPGNPINYETNLTVSNVTDSPNNYVSTNLFASDLYPLNEFGPEGGFGSPIGVNLTPVLEPNQGPYYPLTSGQMEGLPLINEFYIESAYVTNKWGPSGGYKDLVIITDTFLTNPIYQPFWNPGYYNYSSYSLYNVIFQDDPIGSNGPLSSDSYLAKIGATQLKFAFEERVAQEINQATLGVINLDTITDPFTASLLASGQQPFFIRDWKITVPENPLANAVNLANRITGTYFPVSFIPGDYFNENSPYVNPQQQNGALNTINNLTGGLLSPILNKSRNPSEIFVANSGNGTRSTLFAALNYNLYRPSYNIGLLQGLSALANAFVDQDSPATGTYYVGSPNAEPSLIDSPPNQVPVNQFGEQQATIVYGPQELGILYEGNESQIKFGLKGRSYTDGGGITGQLVWTSPKYKGNAGFRATQGGGAGSLDDDFNQISADYLQYQSVDIPFKPGSILYNTQRLIESADQLQGQARLKHVGTAINQVSKVFNDGYKELTKGSQVLSYVNQADGTQAGLEYCRVFQKDTPYYTYADLQKSDGITKTGRQFDYSVLDNTYNLNIAPLRNPGSTNIVDNKVKKYMFSLENLAWRTSDRPGFTYDELPTCEKGPNGGRIMWFPPYNLTFSDDSRPEFNPTTFLGRPEPIYTYKNTSRSGQLNWTIIVDNPAMMNTIIEKQMKGANKDRVQSIIDSFFAGCMKYDLYELAAKFNTIPSKDLYTYQQILNNPRLTSEEQIQVLQSIPVNNEGGNEGKSSGADNTSNSTATGNQEAQNPQPETVDLTSKYEGYGFYFHNDIPKGNPAPTAASPYNVYYNEYLGLQNGPYKLEAPQKVISGSDVFSGSGVQNFFNEVVIGNFNYISTELLKQIEDILVNQNGKIDIEMIGSASAIASVSYNKLLSERRNNSVLKWFLQQPLSGGTTIQKYYDDKKFNIVLNPNGEEIVIAKTREEASATTTTTDVSVNNAQGGNILTASVNCRNNVKDATSNPPKVTTQAEWYSVPAMACRRVAISKIVATVQKKPEDPVITPPVVIDTSTNNPQNILTGITQSIKPEPKITVQQKLKEGISKKILRNLFTECDYFEVIKETDPMIYDTIKDRIKFFSPAFHSMTPEGLNARLTFLHQCTRPGQTIPIIGPDGRPKYNDALNTSFGAPPVLVLRIGDFFNTKIIPTSLGLTFEGLDLNPEGIGIQPMLAKVSMGFNIIGGMGLKEPVQQLQNALSFNFYANTEIYDERATATEDTSKLDQYVVNKITGGLPPVSQQQVNQINSVQPQKGGDTVGTVVDGTTMDYAGIYTALEGKLQEYFKAYSDMLSKTTLDYSYGATLIAMKNNNYTKGELGGYISQAVDTVIYGKSNEYQNFADDLYGEVVKDINQGDNPILYAAINRSGGITGKQRRELEEKLKTQVSTGKGEILNSITNNTTNIVSVENELNYIFRQLDVVSAKLDGRLQGTNEPLLYDLSGDTFFNITENSGSIVDVYTFKVKNIIKSFNDLIYARGFTGDYFKKSNSTIDNGSGCSTVVVGLNQSFFVDCPTNRYYSLMSPFFLTENKYQTMINELTSGDEVKSDTNLVDLIKITCENLKNTQFAPFKTYWEGELKKLVDDPIYIQASTWKVPDNTVKTCGYQTPAEGNLNVKTKRIKDLYSKNNLNEQKQTFNGKVTLN
jgi:outer membrane protein OmpA-like peptidoglycan-associated protein